jgi:hypothetical protein
MPLQSRNPTFFYASALQKTIIETQTGEYLRNNAQCHACHSPLLHKGSHTIPFRTLFGKVMLDSPRLHHCACTPKPTKSFSPLTKLLPQRTAPELLFLETKWASLMSYDITTKLLQDVLPIDEKINPATVRNNLMKVADRCEQSLGKEQYMFIDSCAREWKAQPHPEGPIYVGIDGGYLRGWADKKANFEVIVGKSVPQDRKPKCFGFVQDKDKKPKRRLFEVLKSQGMQLNQQVIFLSDGAENLRDLQYHLNPHSEHILDWFHITMKLTVLTNYAKGVKEMKTEIGEEALQLTEKIKWYLWHGNVCDALEHIEALEMCVDPERWNRDEKEIWTKSQQPQMSKVHNYVGEFGTYIARNSSFIVNYGERWRYGELISTGFVESTVNYVVSKRFSKRQQMQWTKQGAHLLLQTRTKVLNDELRSTFEDWYPGMLTNTPQEERVPIAA